VKISWERRIKRRKFKQRQDEYMQAAVDDMLKKEAIQVSSENVITSPIFTVPKKGDDSKRRPVHNLRWVNQHIQKQKFKMLTMKEVKRAIFKNAYMAKIDLKDMFWQVPVHPRDQRFLGFHWQGKNYTFNGLPMGLTSSPMIATKVFKPVIAKLQEMGHQVLIYIDDLLILGRTQAECEAAVRATLTLLDSLGVIVNWDKSELIPTQVITYLGFEIDSAKMTIKAPANKIKNTKKELKKFLKSDTLSAREVASILGKINSLADAIFPARIHTNGLLDFKHKILQKGSWNATMQKTASSIEDCRWWIQNLSVLNGRSLIPTPTDFQAGSDASDHQWGGWIRIGQEVRKFGGFFTEEEANHHINVKELLAISFVIECSQDIIRGHSVRIDSDNTTAVAYANRFGGRHTHLAIIAQKIWERLQQLDATIKVFYLPGEENKIADFQSRNQDPRGEFMLRRALFNKIDRTWGPHSIDLFASHQNSLLTRFVSRIPSPGACALDAFSMDWKGENAWIHPPFMMVSKVLEKVSLLGGEATLVAPLWPAQPWFLPLIRLAVKVPLLLSSHQSVFVNPTGRPWSPSWATLSWRISSSKRKQKAFRRALQRTSSARGIQALYDSMTPFGEDTRHTAKLMQLLHLMRSQLSSRTG
jgi:hypothetical protein